MKFQKTFVPSRNIDRNPGIVKITTIPGLRSLYPDYLLDCNRGQVVKKFNLATRTGWNQTVQVDRRAGTRP